MKVDKKNLEKSQVELNVELSLEEFQPFIKEGAKELSKEIKVEGFRPGKVPLEIVKQKAGEMSILDKAARIAVNKTIDEAIKKEVDGEPIGQPRVDITKLSPDNPLCYKIVLSLLPKIELGDYRNNKIEKHEEETSEEDVDKTIKMIQEQHVKEEKVEREVKDRDKVVVDINMSVNNVPIEGGQSKDTSVIIGKDYLVPGFDKNLIGAKSGDELKFQLDYPEKHHQKNLAGKKVDFKVKTKDVFKREEPELNDEFAKKFGMTDLNHLKTTIKDNIKQEKKIKSEQKTEMNIINKLLGKTKFSEIPTILIEDESRKIVGEIEQNIVSQGGKFDDYLSSIGKVREQLLEEVKEEAEKRVKISLLIREIGIKEGVKASKEEVDKKQQELLDQYKGYEKVEKRIKEPSYRAYLENILINNKVVAKLKEWNVKEKGEKKEEEK
ncbi:trigger factor [bacterium]|nr:trigger factor [bacterium]